MKKKDQPWQSNSLYNPLQTNLIKILSWNHKGFHTLMQFTIPKQKGLTHDMTFHTEFHRPLPKMKGRPRPPWCGQGGLRPPPLHFGGHGRRPRPLSFLVGVCETLYEMSCHVENPFCFCIVNCINIWKPPWFHDKTLTRFFGRGCTYILSNLWMLLQCSDKSIV